jgi:hypothetical protein
MRRWIIAIFVVALVFALGGLGSRLSSAQDKPKKVLPPPPKEIMDEVIRKTGIAIPRIEDVPEEARNPKVKDSGIPKDKGKTLSKTTKSLTNGRRFQTRIMRKRCLRSFAAQI